MGNFSFQNDVAEIHGDFSQLENLISKLKEKHYTDVGVFETAKTTDGKQVAEYGAYNEFGSYTRPDHPPKRSFIRMPIETKQDEIRKDVEKHAQEHIEKGDVKAVFEDIGIACESQIQSAFDTRGFGSWKPNADSTIRKKSKGGKTKDTPLIDDGMLRKAITHRTK